MKSTHKQLLLLISIMTIVSILAIGITIVLLYFNEIEERKNRLTEIVQTNAAILTAVAKFDRSHIHKEYPNPRENTISQIVEASKHFSMTGDVEFTIGDIVNNQINWIVRHKYKNTKEKWDTATVNIGSSLAIPMQLALQGKTGIIKGKDYQDKIVIAAYAPVDVLKIGIVAKTNIYTIQTLYIKNALTAFSFALIVVGIGVFIFFKATNPILQKSEEYAENLKISEAKSRAWIENSPACTKIIDLDFNLQYMSGAGFVMLQLKDNDALVYDKPYPFYFFPESFKTNMTKSLEKVKTTCEITTIEDSAVDIKGNKIWLHSTLIPVSNKKGLEYIMVVSNDITNRKKAEKDLSIINTKQRQASKMEAIGNFSGGIAHDFNNALSPIIGYCGLLLDNHSEFNKKNRQYIEAVKESAITASLLVKRILSFTRNESEVLQPTNLNESIRDSYEFLKSTIPTTINIQLNIEDSLHLILANTTLIRQILMNLCTNSLHAIGNKDDGIINITASNVTIVKELDMLSGNYVVIEVEDNGCGMPKNVMDRAFDPYYTTKALGKGTGIGLSIISGIIKSLNGHINVYSEVNVGTKFVIYIPVCLSSTILTDDEDDDKNIILGNNEHLLCIDDQQFIIDLIDNLLPNLNYRVTSFIDSEDALEEFRKNSDKYDLVLTDMTMPKMNGLKLIKEVQKIKPDIKTILCSGFSEIINGANSHEHHIDAYISKPATLQEYSTVIAKALKN